MQDTNKKTPEECAAAEEFIAGKLQEIYEYLRDNGFSTDYISMFITDSKVPDEETGSTMYMDANNRYWEEEAECPIHLCRTMKA